MLKKFGKIIYQYAYLILPICTLLCLAGFIGSYLFPNEVLDTYGVNTREEEGDREFVQSFTGVENEFGYLMEIDGRALKGFQIGISKNGAALTGAELVYRVYQVPDGFAFDDNSLPDEIDVLDFPLILEKSYDLGTCMDGQYPYLPFDEEDLCKGKLYITFTYRANGNAEPMPGLFANHSQVKQVAAYQNGMVMDGMLKHYYIYSHDTYPLLYDCRVMTFVFLAASATVCYPQRKRKGDEKQNEE